jgi:Domain of Unknown Function (DUF928)
MIKAFQFILIAGILASLSLVAESLQAQIVPSTNPSDREKLQFILPTSAKQDRYGEGQGRPPRRTSGGSRGILCSQQIVALVPGTETVKARSQQCNSESESLLGLTLAATPTFWFYIPEQPASELMAEFILIDNNRVVYRETIPLSQKPGIISIIPNFPLELNKSYRWSFVVAINPERPFQHLFVEGLVQRIEANTSLDKQLQTAKSERDRIAIYARNGIWHDAIAALGNMYRQSPQNSNWKNDWSNLLDSVGLRAIAEVPLLDCCDLGQKGQVLGNEAVRRREGRQEDARTR